MDKRKGVIAMEEVETRSFNEFLSCVSVHRFEKGDAVQMIDHEDSLFFLKKAEEGGFIIDFPDGHLVVSDSMIRDCPHFTEREIIVNDKWEGGGICRDDILDKDFEVVYSCGCPSAFYTKSDYVKWEMDRLNKKKVASKKIGRNYRPHDFPEYWDNGRCSMCGRLVVRREIKKEEVKRWKEWKEKI